MFLIQKIKHLYLNYFPTIHKIIKYYKHSKHIPNLEQSVRCLDKSMDKIDCNKINDLFFFKCTSLKYFFLEM